MATRWYNQHQRMFLKGKSVPACVGAINNHRFMSFMHTSLFGEALKDSAATRSNGFKCSSFGSDTGVKW